MMWRKTDLALFEDFEIRFSPISRRTFRAIVTRAPAPGSASGVFEIPDILEKRDLAETRDIVLEDAAPDAAAAMDPKAQGQLLYDALFQGALRDLFQRSLGLRTNLRLRLILDDDPSNPAILAFYALPWELLYDGEHRFLSKNVSFSIVREFNRVNLDRKPPRERPRVLLLSSNPAGLTPLALDSERRQILQSLKKAGATATCLPEKGRRDLTRDDVFRTLERGFHVVHFMGHGGDAKLYFTDAQGRVEALSAAELWDEMNALPSDKRPLAIVLNACKSAAAEMAEDGLNGVAVNLVKAGTPAVVAMRSPISDKAAIAFSRGFYERLAKGSSLDRAMTNGRMAIDRSGDPVAEWAIPSLFTGLADARIVGASWKTALARWNKTVVAAAVALAAVCFWMLTLPGQTTLHLTDIEIETPKRFDKQALWTDKRPIEGLLASAGLGAVGASLTVPSPETLKRLDLDYTVALHLRRDKQTTLEAIIHNGRGERLSSISVHGPANDDDAAMLDLKLNLAERLAAELGGKAPERPAIDPAAAAANNQAVQLTTDEPDAAEALFRKAIALAPDYAEARANLAALLLKTQRPEAALEHARSAIEQAPASPRFHYLAGKILLALGNLPQARASFDEAVALDRGYADAYHELGKLLLEERRWGKARAVLAKAAALRPEHAPTRKHLGRALLEMKDREGAADALTKALTLFLEEREIDTPLQMAETRYLLARTLFEQERPDEACRYFSEIRPDLLARWRAHAENLAAQLPCEAKRHALAGIVVDVRGNAHLTFANGKTDKVLPGQILDLDTALHLGVDGFARVLCKDHRLVTIEEPGVWRHGEAACDQGKACPEWLLADFLAPLEQRVESGLASLGVKSRPAGDASLFAMSPRGMMGEARPGLIWTAVPNATAYRVRIDEPGKPPRWRKFRTEELELESLALGSTRFELARASWPDAWPPLAPGVKCRLSVRPETARPGANDMTSEFETLEPKQEASLARRLEEAAALAGGDGFRLRLEAAILQEAGCHAAALERWLALIESELPGPPWAETAKTLLAMDLPAAAAPALEAAVAREPSPDRAARLRQTLGRVYLALNRAEEAEAQFSKTKKPKSVPTP